MFHVDSPVMVKIARIRKEAANVRTFTFRYTLHSKPGQFVMLWVPGYDQKPFSIGNDTGEEFQLAIFALGESTKHLFRMKVGDRVGVTGPYGTWYRFTPHSHLITVGGGYGAAPLGFLAERAVADHCTVDFCIGARSSKHLLFERRARRAGATVHVATDNGSRGYRGFVTDLLQQILEKRKQQGILKKVKVFACGPELMQKRVVDIAKQYHVPSEISIERYMKCGFGICGNCCIDDSGIPTCTEGTIISGKKALASSEFGVFHRDKTGRKKYFLS